MARMNSYRFASLGVGVLITMFTCPDISAQTYAAGYEVLRIAEHDRPIQLDVWYPSRDGDEREHNYGLSIGRIASGADFSGNNVPVVLLSHGALGAAANYSWIAEHLARRGFLVLGVSHFGESPVFGADTVRPESVARFDDRTRDLNAALEFLLERSRYASRLDPERLAAIGHSSGGASVLMLAGVEFSPALLKSYCTSSASTSDKGCEYPSSDVDAIAQTLTTTSRRLTALVVMDPAAGPGFSDSALQTFSLPVLVIASVQNDFLPYSFHAGRVSERLPGAEVVRLDAGEGHFIYLDVCASPIEAMGVPLCSDRPGIERASVHGRLASIIEQFLADHLGIQNAAQ